MTLVKLNSSNYFCLFLQWSRQHVQGGSVLMISIDPQLIDDYYLSANS